jgi:hypothetical protein
LIANTGATVAVLATLIALLGPLSGAHFNPAVSVVEALQGKLAWSGATAYKSASKHRCKKLVCVSVERCLTTRDFHRARVPVASKPCALRVGLRVQTPMKLERIPRTYKKALRTELHLVRRS